MRPALSIKRVLPRSLFGRSLMMVIMPVVLLQIVVAYIFYERHWDEVTRRLGFSVAGDIAAVIDLLRDAPDPAQKKRILDMARIDMDLQISFEPGKRIQHPMNGGAFYSILDRMVGRAIEERFGVPYKIDTTSLEDRILISLQLSDGVLRVITPQKRLFSTTTYIFIMWMIGTSVVLLAVAVVFLRNQIRPIRRLAEAADSFGKGRDVDDFHPSGAAEIRRAAAAFLVMRERIQRQITQRTEMLAGVSHDLRTPLTRMKLELALLGDSDEVRELKRDVADMEKMITGYLAFARGQDSEAAVATDLPELLNEVVSDARRQGGDVALLADPNMVVPIRPNAFRRCVMNLVENAIRHARHVQITARRLADSIEIAVDDDGPGIPADRREDVFRAFTRLDRSRNPETGGVGLGLTIARDVIRGHGGDITLSQAPSGGLRALLRMPV
ncbi:MAG TPA: ATP-binding protein [Candidatus Cybelea sp.]|nr:ATP-binding protein [Candidatus Cybelea sp.]